MIEISTTEGGVWRPIEVGDEEALRCLTPVTENMARLEIPGRPPLFVHSVKLSDGRIWDVYFKGFRPVFDW